MKETNAVFMHQNAHQSREFSLASLHRDSDIFSHPIAPRSELKDCYKMWGSKSLATTRGYTYALYAAAQHIEAKRKLDKRSLLVAMERNVGYQLPTSDKGILVNTVVQGTRLMPQCHMQFKKEHSPDN